MSALPTIVSQKSANSSMSALSITVSQKSTNSSMSALPIIVSQKSVNFQYEYKTLVLSNFKVPTGITGMWQPSVQKHMLAALLSLS